MPEHTDDHPAWLAPGSEVSVLRSTGSFRSETTVIDLTVAKVGKRDIVLSDGTRFTLTGLTRDGQSVLGRSRDAWTPSSSLVPRSSAEAEAARVEQGRSKLVRRGMVACDDLKRALRWGNDERAAEEYVRLLSALEGLGITAPIASNAPEPQP